MSDRDDNNKKEKYEREQLNIESSTKYKNDNKIYIVSNWKTQTAKPMNKGKVDAYQLF